MEEYKGFRFKVHAGKHPARDEWSPSGEVLIPQGEEDRVQTFDALTKQLYPTREDAIRAGREILMRWIDSQKS